MWLEFACDTEWRGIGLLIRRHTCPWWVRFPPHAPDLLRSVNESGGSTRLLIAGHSQGCVIRVHRAPPSLESEPVRVLSPAGNRPGVTGVAWLSNSPALRQIGTSSSQGAATASKTDGVTKSGMTFEWSAFRQIGRYRRWAAAGLENRHGAGVACGRSIRPAFRQFLQPALREQAGLQILREKFDTFAGCQIRFTGGLPVSPRDSESRPRTFDSFPVSHFDTAVGCRYPARLLIPQ